MKSQPLTKPGRINRLARGPRDSGCLMDEAAMTTPDYSQLSNPGPSTLAGDALMSCAIFNS